MQPKYKVAYLVTHPIQYQAPMLRYIVQNSEIDLTALFMSDFSVKGYSDPGFGKKIEWDTPLLEGYKHIFLPVRGDNKRISNPRPFVTGLRKVLSEGGYDALWTHGYAHQVQIRAILIAKSLGMKVLVRAESQRTAVGRTKSNAWLKETALRALFAKVDGFLTIGSMNREYYESLGVPDSKLFRVPYAVDNAFFQSRAAEAAKSRDAFRAELGLEPGRPVILYASKLSERKKSKELLEAYAKLSPDGKTAPKPYLLFVGDGTERPMLEAKVNELGWDTVKFLGFQNQTKLPAFFDLCDVFVLASAKEQWGLIVNEVMNAGRAVIISNEVGCGPDLVRDGENGYIVPVDDVDALSDRLRRITGDPELALSMGRRGREIIDTWGFQQDLEGLEAALDATTGKLRQEGA